MSKEFDKIILDHYDSEAESYGLDPNSTMLDVVVRERETELIGRFVNLAVGSIRAQGISDTDISICDVGCGNGYTLMTLSLQYPDITFRGFEFSPSMRALAESRFISTPGVSISKGDVRSIDATDAVFDIVVCQRVLINLLDPVDQTSGLAELARVIRPGGHLLSIEAFQEPLIELNLARDEFDLTPLTAAHHNLYLSSDFYTQQQSLVPIISSTLEPGLPGDFLPSNFLSSHYFVSRVLHPLALGPDRPFSRNSRFVDFLTNSIDRPIGDYAPIKAHAFRKVNNGGAQL